MADQFKGSSAGNPTPQKTGGQFSQDMSSPPKSPQQHTGGNPSSPGAGGGSSNAGGGSSSSGSASPQGLADKAISAGRDLKSTATDLAGSSVDAIKGQASGFVDAAKNAASQAGDRLQKEVDSRKGAGAEYVGKLADTLRRAAGEFDADLPIAATYIRKAATQVENVSDTIQDGNINDLVRGAQSFARQQPTAFLGLAVLAGFGVIRFLKSSAASAEGAGNTASGNSFKGQSGSPSRAGMNRYASNTSNRGYRDEFTK